MTSKKFDPQDAFANIFGEHRRPKAPRLADQVPASAGVLNKTSKLFLTGLLGNRTN
jgi:transcriptional coactivator HFI1/ADA1